MLAQKPWIFPIPGTTNLPHLDENLGVLAVELTADDLREIDAAASNITVHGARLPQASLELTRREAALQKKQRKSNDGIGSRALQMVARHGNEGCL